jgi:hypothetical protein
MSTEPSALSTIATDEVKAQADAAEEGLEVEMSSVESATTVLTHNEHAEIAAAEFQGPPAPVPAPNDLAAVHPAPILPTARPMPRATPDDPLAALRAMTDEERIALFT